MVFSRLKLQLAKLSIRDKVALEEGEPYKTKRNFVNHADDVIFYTKARSCDEARQILQELVERSEKGRVTIQLNRVEHWSDEAEWNDGVPI